MLLENNLTFTKFVRRNYDDKFAQSGAKIGATLNLRIPPVFSVTKGPNLVVQNYTETQFPLTVNQQAHVDVSFSSAELTLSIQDFSDRVLAPQIAQLANQIDADGLAQYVNVYKSVGVPGTPNTTFAPFLQAGVQLDNSGTPRDGNRNIVLSPQGQADAVGGQFTTVFNDQDTVSKQYLNGTMGRALGFKWSMDQNVANVTAGPMGGAPVIAGAGQTGATITTSGWTAAAASRLLGGETFTLPNVFEWNQLKGGSTGKLQSFTVTGPVSSDGTGAATVPISPSIITTGTGQTVSGSPANGAALTFTSGAAGTVTPVGLAFHRDAFAFVSVDLEDVSKYGAWSARVSDDQLGVSMRVTRQYAIGSDTVPCRIDVLYGWATPRPQEACRVYGSNT